MKKICITSLSNELERARIQALKDMLLEERRYDKSFDDLMQSSGMTNPGFNRSSYKSIIKK